MAERIVVTGGTGFVGQALVKALAPEREVVVLTRKNELPPELEGLGSVRAVTWDATDDGEWTRTIDGASAVVHLAGAQAVGVRWNEAVKQRLSRGRNLLRNEVEAVIERSLRKTKPTSALTIAIMAALPGIATQAQAAVVAGAATKAAPAAAKSLLSWSLLATFASPLITLAAMPFFARWAERTGKSPREKRYIVQYTWTIVG